MPPAFLAVVALLLGACSPAPVPWDAEPAASRAIVPVPAGEVVRYAGDPKAGLRFLLEGNVTGSGYPLALLPDELRAKLDPANPAAAKEVLGPARNFVKDERRGVWIVQQQCLLCHGTKFQDEIRLGLGFPWSDFTEGAGFKDRFANLLVRFKLGGDSPEFAAFMDIRRYSQEIGRFAVTEQIGPNPAFRIEETCARRRDPVTLAYTEEPQFDIPTDYTPVADVPPLWHTAKKRTLYWNGMGRGDLRKLLMQAGVIGLKDVADAERVLGHMGDVAAWTQSIEPPKWPRPVDAALVAQGREVFVDHCAKCHGRYGDRPEYPNKIIPLEKIGTDPYYARYWYHHSKLADWYNRSWFATTEPRSSMEPSLGYVAPPLDGIWATAPYLHNGSVPDLASVLESSRRPARWQRTSPNPAYDFERVGWSYTVPADGKPADRSTVYDTTLRGYGNQGHDYGDDLTTAERRALIEYLKTL